MLVRESIRNLFKPINDPKILKKYNKELKKIIDFTKWVKSEKEFIEASRGNIDEWEYEEMFSALDNKIHEFYYTIPESLQDNLMSNLQ